MVKKQVQDLEDGHTIDGMALLQKAGQAVIDEMLDIRRPGRGPVREIIEAKASGQLGRVRFDRLEEGEEILWEGDFGPIKSGTYMGQEVAIMKTPNKYSFSELQFRWALPPADFG